MKDDVLVKCNAALVTRIRELGETAPSLTAIAKELNTDRSVVRAHLRPDQIERIGRSADRLRRLGAVKGGRRVAELRRAREIATNGRRGGLSVMTRGVVLGAALLRGEALDVSRITKLCDVSRATAKRDMLTLEIALPVRRENGRIWLDEDYRRRAINAKGTKQ